MNRTLLRPVGVLCVLLGILWLLQGTGYLGGSVMSGVTFWAIAGAVLIVVGIVLMVIAHRARRDRQ